MLYSKYCRHIYFWELVSRLFSLDFKEFTFIAIFHQQIQIVFIRITIIQLNYVRMIKFHLHLNFLYHLFL